MIIRFLVMIQMDWRWEKGINEFGQEVRGFDLVYGYGNEEGQMFQILNLRD